MKSITGMIRKKIKDKGLRLPDPCVDSLLDTEVIRNLSPDAMVYSEMYLSENLYVHTAVINNNGVFLFVPGKDGMDADDCKNKADDIRKFFSLTQDNSFVFFANESKAYLYDDKGSRLIELDDLYSAYENLYDNLLLPYVDMQYLGFDGLEDLIGSAEDKIAEKEEDDRGSEKEVFEYNGEIFEVNDDDGFDYSGDPEYVKYRIDTKTATQVCNKCVGLDHNERPEKGHFVDDDGTEYILRHSARKIGGEGGVDIGLIGDKKWYRVSDEDPNRLFWIAVLGGWFGLHKFVQGQIADGFLYLLTCGCLGVLPAIDILMMLTGNYTYYEVDYFEDEKRTLHRSKNKVYMRRMRKVIVGILGMVGAVALSYVMTNTLYQAVYSSVISVLVRTGTNMSPEDAETMYRSFDSFTNNPGFSLFK